MRDSIGGTLLFWIVLILLSVFIVFIAFIIKYARVYKMKNSMINYIERNEGIASKDEFDANLASLGYPSDGGYKVCRYLAKDKNKGGYYYVELYSITAFPLVGNFVAVKIAIRGETKNITTGTKIRSMDSSQDGWFTGTTSECKYCNIGRSCTTTEA